MKMLRCHCKSSVTPAGGQYGTDEVSQAFPGLSNYVPPGEPLNTDPQRNVNLNQSSIVLYFVNLPITIVTNCHGVLDRRNGKGLPSIIDSCHEGVEWSRNARSWPEAVIEHLVGRQDQLSE